MNIQFLGQTLQSPFIIGSGPLSYGAEGMIALHKAGAGAVVTKTIRDDKAVNPEPHIAAIGNRSMVNSEKWSDYSGERWIEQELPAALDAGVTVIASLGHTADEVKNWLPRIDALGVPFFELVSYGEEDIVPMVKEAVSLTDRPVLAKISPNWNDPVGAALACLEAGAAGITAIDSLGPVLSINIQTGRPSLGGIGGMGWMTGSGLKPLALRYVAQIAARTDKPVLGLGGVMSPEDAVEMVMAGASAVGVCTFPILQGVQGLEKLIGKFDILLSELGYPTLERARGVVLPHLPDREILGEQGLLMKTDHCRLCGICLTRCPYQALSKEEGALKLNTQRCRRCGLCVSSCPDRNLSLQINFQ